MRARAALACGGVRAHGRCRSERRDRLLDRHDRHRFYESSRRWAHQRTATAAAATTTPAAAARTTITAATAAASTVLAEHGSAAQARLSYQIPSARQQSQFEQIAPRQTGPD